MTKKTKPTTEQVAVLRELAKFNVLAYSGATGQWTLVWMNFLPIRRGAIKGLVQKKLVKISKSSIRKHYLIISSQGRAYLASLDAQGAK
jgi:hypothetical protein